jgi:hypothetical protein
MKSDLMREKVTAPCGCSREFVLGPDLGGGAPPYPWVLWFYCDEHFAMCEASTPIIIHGGPAQPCHLEAIAAVQAGFRAIRDWP